MGGRRGGARRGLACVVACLVTAAPLLAGCDGGGDGDGPPAGGATSPATGPDAADLPRRRLLTVATFNVLGASHTSPGGGAAEYYPPAAEWIGGTMRRIRTYRPDVLGLQELQARQSAVLRRRLGDRFGYFGDLDNAVVWRRARLAVLERTTLTIPYFYDNLREMPVVVLRVRSTGDVVTVVNVHNPADVRGEVGDNRAEAVARERAFVEAERAKGRAVLLVGDLNAEEEAFCALTEGGVLVAANGGSHRRGTCRPPDDAAIDWILGAGVEFNGFHSDASAREEKVSDHPFVVATVARLRPGRD
ncbi:endonuclease/exonuclease/phosphatase family protein [Nocardioides dongxiaopingii]|uniref:endonuclease/exonuclease/phosphatase family protein n=1 Tax=Nocardioides dongxiaopingii TaxID=2576036 RepID=UPI0010C7628C|nr:endonuclease/exonuclease/phosphatase family protein [Nocardioides dongxiaopingii]